MNQESTPKKKRGRPALNKGSHLINIHTDTYTAIKRMSEVEGRTIGETVHRLVFGQ